VSARDDNRIRRRLAATAATAAIAVGGGLGTASAQTSPARGGKAPTRIAGSERTNGADDMEAIAREEQADQRRRLASGLAPHIDGVDSLRIEAALAAGTPVELARRIGVGEDEIADAFEAMSRRALERRANR
jgi:hypothetical protein